MVLLLLRHASIVKQGKRDLLTNSGKRFVEKLPMLIKEKGYDKIDIIFYVNKVQSGKRDITRCFETIKNISARKIEVIRWNNFPIKNPEEFLGKTIIVCYVKRLLKKVPIEPFNRKEFYKDKSKTDLLYEKIPVFKYENGKYRLINEINTNDEAIDKS